MQIERLHSPDAWIYPATMIEDGLTGRVVVILYQSEDGSAQRVNVEVERVADGDETHRVFGVVRT